MAFYHQRRYITNIIQQSKREYYSTLLEENRNNVKTVFTIANELLFRNEPFPLPLTDDKQKLANEFNEFFCRKVQTIKDNLQPIEETDIDPHYIEMEYLINYRFNEFEIIHKNTVLKLIKKSTTKSCELDLVPTNLLKQYVEVLVPSVHHIITTSLLQGCFTDNLKEALLRSLLKKSNLDLIFKNYHPVSNLIDLSKIVKKAVCN